MSEFFFDIFFLRKVLVKNSFEKKRPELDIVSKFRSLDLKIE